MNTEIHIILEKLDSFIKKFYVNELIKGAILFFAISTFYFLSIFFVESFTFFPTYVRTIIFYISLFSACAGFVWYVIIPLFHVFKIGKTLSYEQASVIVSKHFPEIKDSLLNTLQLSAASKSASESLMIAAINQKISKLKPLPFSAAISTKQITKYAKYFAVAVLLLIVVSVVFPDSLASGAKRIIKHSEHFEKPAPFEFNLTNKDLYVVKGEDITIKLGITGSYIPNQVFISFSGNTFAMLKTSNSQFEYIYNNCNNSFDFYFVAEEYSSKKYLVVVQHKPQLTNFTIDVIVPKYTQEKNFQVQNSGDIIVPAGSEISWNLQMNQAQKAHLFFHEDSSELAFDQKDGAYFLTQNLYKTQQYTLCASNQDFDSHSIISYTYTVIPDVYPSIEVEAQKDSLQFYINYFKGVISDDYGFSDLNFVWYVTSQKDSLFKVPIEHNSAMQKQQFFYMHDFSALSEGDSIMYYFEVADNDAIQGAKTTKTSIKIFALPTYKQRKETENNLSKDIDNQAEKSKDLTDDILKDIKDIQQKLLNQNVSEWERNNLLEEMKEKQLELKNEVQKMTDLFEQKSQLQNQFDEQSQEILEKQQQIQDLLENLMDSELQQMFDELNQLMEDFKKDDFFELSEEMKMSYEELSKQLDRDLEMLKRADVEQSVYNMANKLEELAQKQQKLSEEAKKGKADSEELKQKQDEISEQFNDLKEEYNNTQDKNNELENSFDLPDFGEEFDQIDDSMEQSKEELGNNQEGKSSKSMKQSSEQMQKLGEELQQNMEGQVQAQSMEDMNNLRQILDNLITFSVEQEQLMEQSKKLSFADPKYAAVASKQNSLKENHAVIKDSLYALSMRVPQISSEINKELFNIHKDLRHALHYLEQRQKSGAVVKQQYIMTSANNLALLLSEVLDAMQQAMAQQMSGGQQKCQNQSCGEGGKGSMPKLQQMQKSLKQQMQQMLQQMQSGQMIPSQQAKQLSKMLAEQQMMKQMIGEMIKNGTISPDGLKELKEINRQMENIEQDIVYQRISQNTINRQQQIITRLLEAERAEQERDKDKKRESKQADENYEKSSLKLQFQDGTYMQNNDVLQKTNMKLNSYYNKIFNNYLLKINEK